MGLDPFLAMVPTAIVLFGLGYVIQRGLINLVVNAPIFITLLLTFGLNLLLVNGHDPAVQREHQSIVTSYTTDSLVLPGGVFGAVRAAHRGGARGRRHPRAGLYLTRGPGPGLSILATGMDRGAARLMGIRAGTSTRSRSVSPPRWPARPAPPSAR